MSSSPPAQPFRLRSLAISVYLPSFLFAVGQGAMIPVIPLFALELGASVAMAGAIVALRGIGMLAFDIPAGILVRRLGERGAMLVGTLALAAVAVGASLSPSPLVLAPLVFVMGCAWSIWMLARLSHASEVAPFELRGRVLSLLGGSNRMGTFVGPFVGGFVAEWAGLESAFYVQAALAAAAAAVMFLVVPADEGRDTVPGGAGHHPMGQVLRENVSIFATAGSVAIAIAALRSTRQAIIPLWGSHIGLSAAEIGVIFGLSAAVDMAMFYPAGVVMDRLGRKWTAVPCLLVFSAGMMAIPLTGTFASLLLASLVTGFGNGMGAGIVMTLGADYASPASRAEFLGVWRFITDIGTAGGPVLLSAVTAVSTLGTATVMTGGVGLAGAAIMYFLVAEPLAHKSAVVFKPDAAPP
jgi:MFS family permease